MARHCARVLLLTLNASAWVPRRVDFGVRPGKIFSNKGKICQPKGITSHSSYVLSLSIMQSFLATLAVLLQKAESCTCIQENQIQCEHFAGFKIPFYL